MPRNSSETDRKKSQFDKQERAQLLGIMKQYAPLLDNSTSTHARKKIWTVIEEEFKTAGFTRKTSAQLKKYWQNYKYHCKKSRALGKEQKSCADSATSKSAEWNRYQIFVENRSAAKFSEIPAGFGACPDLAQMPWSEPEYRSTELYENNAESSRKSDTFIDLSRVKTEQDEETISVDFDSHEINPLNDRSIDEVSWEERKEIVRCESEPESPACNALATQMRNRIVVSNANISDNSVTVSVIYPENKTANPEIPARNSEEALPVDRNEERPRENSRENGSRAVPSELPEPGDRHNRANFIENAGNEEHDSMDRPGSDSQYESEAREFSQEDRSSVPMDCQEDDAAGRSRSFEGRNNRRGSSGYVFLSDYRNQLKHRLLLQKLEMEEKRLKVKIAEMAIQEVQLRMKALTENMRRTEELHRLRVAGAFTGNGTVLERGRRTETRGDDTIN